MAAAADSTPALGIKLPPGCPDLRVIEFSGTEEISVPFFYRLTLAGEPTAVVPFEIMMGQPVKIWIDRPGRPRRYFDGIIGEFSETERNSARTVFVAELHPSLWLLTHNRRCRIFQGKTVLEILQVLFRGLDVAWEALGDYAPHNYCVQYMESDLDFARRLMEEEGIHFHFRTSDQGHVLVIADSRSPAAETLPEPVLFNPVAGGVHPGPRFTEWRVTQRMGPTSTSSGDHSFQMSANPLSMRHPLPETMTAGKQVLNLAVRNDFVPETYDYPGGYVHRFDAVDPNGMPRPGDLPKIFEHGQSALRLEASRQSLALATIEGKGDAAKLTAGETFHLRGHTHADGVYRAIAVEHHYRSEGGSDPMASSAGERASYSNRVRSLPNDVAFVPPRRMPLPKIYGTQVATVVGPIDELIHTEKFGRIRVRFHWNREGDGGADSSCWLRVAQSWAGKGWGSLHIPRVGQEVLIDFLEGDPDQPIVVGCLYNDQQMPPMELPAYRATSGLRSRSEGGELNNASEMFIDDTSGSEQFYFRAERDMTVEVENDHTTHIAGNRTTYIGYGSGEPIGSGAGGASGSQIVYGNETSFTNGDVFCYVGGANQSYTMGYAQTVVVGDCASLTIGSSRSIMVGVVVSVSASVEYDFDLIDMLELTAGDSDNAVRGTLSMEAGVDVTATAGAAIALTAGADVTVAAFGDATVSAAGTISLLSPTITINGADINISCDSINILGNVINLTGDSVNITAGGDVSIKAGGECNIAAGDNVSLEAASVVLSGGSINMVAGGDFDADTGGDLNLAGSAVNIEAGELSQVAGIVDME